MISSALWQFLHFLRKLWVRVTLIALLSVLAAGLAAVTGSLIPDSLSNRFNDSSVKPILTILATAMLGVTTFSLNVMVSSQQAAAGLATPRAHRLILEDTTTHSVLATFLGAFLFSLVALLLYPTGAFAGRAPVMLFGMTLVVVVLVVVAMLRWIDHLSKLGGMDAILDLVEHRADESLIDWRKPRCLGGRALRPDLPQAAHCICTERNGYIRRVDMAALSEWAVARDTIVQIVASPGAHVVAGDPLLRCFADPGETARKLRRHVVIASTRTFDQDVRYGPIVLAEIATHALSPGVNDPGTAIEVITRLERLLAVHAAEDESDDSAACYPRLFLHPVAAADMIEDAYAAIARDGAGMIEVAMRLLHALHRLEQGPLDVARAAREMHRRLLDHAELALPTRVDKRRIGL